jgi:4-amino-4-deoxy-L-arabinose transferase-like glycosyltransferase
MEPPILEVIASFAYRILGGEYLWIPRLLSSVFWMGGGIFLYLIAKKITTPNAAVLSLLFYLFVPFSIFASRAFMPDPLMVMLLLVSVFTILQYHEQPTRRRLLVASLASASAVFAKPGICFFQLLGVFVSLAVYRQGLRRSLTDRRVLTFTTLCVLPTGLYYLYGRFFAGFIQANASGRITPYTLLEPSFWRGWGEQVGVVVGYTALVGSLMGIMLLRKGLPRALMVGLWSGYILFGLTFANHVSTHDYYSLQLIPVVALSLGPLGEFLLATLKQAGAGNQWGRVIRGKYGRVATIALLVLALFFSAIEYRKTIQQIMNQNRAASGYSREVAAYQKIGEEVNHSQRTIILVGKTHDSGYPLMYHGRILGRDWTSNDKPTGTTKIREGSSTQEHLNAMYSKASPEYFIISTQMWKSKTYEDLRNLLTENFPIASQDNGYIVVDLRKKD